MKNETKQTALQYFLMGLIDLEIGKNIPTDKEKELHNLFDSCKAIEISEKESSYADGFSAGYDRAIELVEWKIQNELKINNK